MLFRLNTLIQADVQKVQLDISTIFSIVMIYTSDPSKRISGYFGGVNASIMPDQLPITLNSSRMVAQMCQGCISVGKVYVNVT
jgi:hypothetical protein